MPIAPVPLRWRLSDSFVRCGRAPPLMAPGGLWCGHRGEDHAGHGLDRLVVGEALADAQGVPGPERGRVADECSQPSALAGVAGNGCARTRRKRLSWSRRNCCCASGSVAKSR